MVGEILGRFRETPSFQQSLVGLYPLFFSIGDNCAARTHGNRMVDVRIQRTAVGKPKTLRCVRNVLDPQ